MLIAKRQDALLAAQVTGACFLGCFLALFGSLLSILSFHAIIILDLVLFFYSLRLRRHDLLPVCFFFLSFFFWHSYSYLSDLSFLSFRVYFTLALTRSRRPMRSYPVAPYPCSFSSRFFPIPSPTTSFTTGDLTTPHPDKHQRKGARGPRGIRRGRWMSTRLLAPPTRKTKKMLKMKTRSAVRSSRRGKLLPDVGDEDAGVAACAAEPRALLV